MYYSFSLFLNLHSNFIKFIGHTNGTLLSQSFNSKIKFNIDKAYLDKKTYLKNVNGLLVFSQSKLYKLDLKSKFPNNKDFRMTVNTNNNNEAIKVVIFASKIVESALSNPFFIVS